jgi:hypothetical protein
MKGSKKIKCIFHQKDATKRELVLDELMACGADVSHRGGCHTLYKYAKPILCEIEGSSAKCKCPLGEDWMVG